MQHRPIPTLFVFDADLMDLILTTLSDIHTLESFVLSSKSVYNTFNARRSSVLRAVVSNHLGPATPPAMRLLKVMTNVESYWHGWLSPLPVNKLPRENDFQLNDPRMIITTREAHILAINHDVVQDLESLYSWRHKDPRSSLSQLTPCESERFQTALYRVWFVCALYGRSAPANRVGKSKSKRLSEILKGLGQMQAKFLQSFPPPQMVLLLEAWRFMMDLAAWVVRAEIFQQKSYRSLEAYLVWSGPRMTLRAFRGKLANVDRKFVPALSASHEQFCDVFNAASSSKQPTSSILTSPDECFTSTLKCQQCPQTALWSESNWSYLRGIVPPSEFFEFLELPWWNPYIDAITLEKICHDTPYSQLVSETFMLRSKIYRAWKPEHWLCMACLRTVVHDSIEAFCQSRGYPRQADQ